MKANDLRIGNYVAQTDGKIHEICGLSIHKFEINEIEFFPINLSADWFLDFGFSVKSEKSRCDTPIYFLSGMDIDYCFYWADFRQDYGFYIEYTDSPFTEDNGKLYPVSFEIEFVHQLQNLIYTLTGWDLKINKKNESETTKKI
jgi:hypothetical protein